MFRLIQTTETVITPADGPAITLEYVKSHIRAFTDVDDVLIKVWIDAATQYFMEKSGRPPLTEVRELWLDAFPCGGLWPFRPYDVQQIELPHPPLQEVLAVEYLDSTGALVPFSDGASPETVFWQYGAPAGPYARRGWVRPIPGKSWPSAMADPAAARIRYRCGYGDTAEDVPELVRGILCYLVAHFDQFRGAVHEARRGQVLELPYGVQAMLDGFKGTALPSQVLRQGTLYGGWPWL